MDTNIGKRLALNAYNAISERIFGSKQQSSQNRVHNSKTRTDFGINDMINKLEPLMVSFQSLLIWEKPYVSAIAFIAFNCIYWLMVTLSRRFYSTLAIVVFCYYFLKLWTNHIWPEIRVPPNESNDNEGWTPIHPQVLSAPEISRYINEFFIMINGFLQCLIKFRRSHRGLFCITSCFVLSMTAIIGKIVPGVVIVYAMMMTLALGPGIVLYVMPHGWYTTICSFLSQKTNNENNSEDENDKQNENSEIVMPVETRDAFDEMSLNDLNSIEMNPFDLILGDESSLQLLSSSQLDTTLDKELGISVELSNDDIFKFESRAIGDRSPTYSEASNNSSNGIHFVSTHFSRNSTSDEFEDEFEVLSESEIHEDVKLPKRLPKESSV